MTFIKTAYTRACTGTSFEFDTFCFRSAIDSSVV